ncbi:WRKY TRANSCRIPTION FACTOR PROTEIN 1-RELATED [Salix purpurea]|uniref:WRKY TRANSCRIPTION FACTOR PROTEIN 1-RELATED n=1 Tax=Salix purpurea TaxID=77065 RepID=A0A9Q0WBQ0_SALPP|nr:WRKY TRANSCRIPTION FACTOR PROTEIN 1-RELATED [Salix purpurea]
MDNNPAADYKTLLWVPNLETKSCDGDGGDNNRGISIAERRAAKCGFKMKAERINAARFRTTSPLTSPLRSPFVIIPSGISPSALLDSPIMPPNSHVQPSPTSGTFPLSPLKYESESLLRCGDRERGSNAGAGCLSVRFKPLGNSLPLSENQGDDFDTEATLMVDPSKGFQLPVAFSKQATPDKKCTSDSHTDVNISDVQIGSSDLASNPICVQRETIHGENAASRHPVEEHKRTLPATTIGRSSEDGYNWRKYGQKQVKGSEYPRSYYKCTRANCLVKKKIECAHEGQITKIIYKDTHNHPKPRPSCGAPPGPASSLDEMQEMDGGGSVQKNTESGFKDIEVQSDWRTDGPERTSSTSEVTELSDPTSTTQNKSLETFESTETPELPSTLASHDDDGVTQGSLFGADADYESESKRRKIESCLVETSMASRAAREPRVVVQIESEMDMLDDGYRWRKYGQKVVKGNPNPRSYYKCTSAGCSVRKHVERASHDLKYVILTYEGKHNHEVPAARNSSHGKSTGRNLSQTTGNARLVQALARNSDAPNLEALFVEFAPSFDRKPVFKNDYLRSSFPGNFSNEMNLGSSFIYPMRFPPSNHQLAASHSGSVASFVPDFPGSLSPCLQTAENLSLARVDFSGDGKPVGQAHTFIQGPPSIRPKPEEQKGDNLYGASSSMDSLNAASSSLSVYRQLLGSFLQS